MNKFKLIMYNKNCIFFLKIYIEWIHAKIIPYNIEFVILLLKIVNNVYIIPFTYILIFISDYMLFLYVYICYKFYYIFTIDLLLILLCLIYVYLS